MEKVYFEEKRAAKMHEEPPLKVEAFYDKETAIGGYRLWRDGWIVEKEAMFGTRAMIVRAAIKAFDDAEIAMSIPRDHADIGDSVVRNFNRAILDAGYEHMSSMRELRDWLERRGISSVDTLQSLAAEFIEECKRISRLDLF